MPPTVKSLEERTDELFNRLAGVEANVAALMTKTEMLAGGVAGLQAQVQNLSTQTAVTVTGLATANARLDGLTAKLDTVADAFSDFKGRVETTLALTRWIGAFAAATFLGVGAAAFTVVQSVTRLDATIQNQQKTLESVQTQLAKIVDKPDQ